MILSAQQRASLATMAASGTSGALGVYIANALAELDRLQAVVTRRGELLREIRDQLEGSPDAFAQYVVAAATDELAEGEDGG